ncbi:O-antigen ligase family protein [Bradyrhizobium nanningense]
MNRSLGGITPNLIGHYGLAVIVLSTFSRRLIRGGLISAGLALIYYSQARTVLVSALLFLVFVYGVAPHLSRRNLHLFIGLVVGTVIAILALAPLLLPYVTEFTSAATSVANDVERGAASGLSGRTLLWQLGIRALEDHELLGYGFRTRGPVILSQTATVNGHSGLINAALDSGFIGAFLLLAVICTSTYQASVEYVRFRSTDALIVFGFLLSYLPTLAVEPNYFNFSHPTSILFILCLVRGVLVSTKGPLTHGSRIMSSTPARSAARSARKTITAR